MMNEPTGAIGITWREDYEALRIHLECRRQQDSLPGPASRVALAILQLLKAEKPLTHDSVIDYTFEHCGPTKGWHGTQGQGFDRDEYLRRVWPVVAALKMPQPAEALMYVS